MPSGWSRKTGTRRISCRARRLNARSTSTAFSSGARSRRQRAGDRGGSQDCALSRRKQGFVPRERQCPNHHIEKPCVSKTSPNPKRSPFRLRVLPDFREILAEQNLELTLVLPICL